MSVVHRYPLPPLRNLSTADTRAQLAAARTALHAAALALAVVPAGPAEDTLRLARETLLEQAAAAFAAWRDAHHACVARGPV